MTHYKKVVVKRIVSPDGKVVAEAKSIVASSDNNQTDINQSVSVNVSGGSTSSSHAQSSSSSWGDVSGGSTSSSYAQSSSSSWGEEKKRGRYKKSSG